MSLPRIETVECPSCREPQEVAVWASINVTSDPGLKRGVLDGSVGHFQCRSCRHSTTIEYDLLYHDMDKRLACWLKYPDDQGWFGIDPPAATMGDLLGERYVRRIVPSYEELVEKIQIVDADLDDFEVELIKLFVCIREKMDIMAPFVFRGLRKSLLRGSSIAFIIGGEDEAKERVYPLKTVQEAIAGVLPRLPSDNDTWPHVNREYVLRRLSEAGLMKRVQ